MTEEMATFNLTQTEAAASNFEYNKYVKALRRHAASDGDQVGAASQPEKSRGCWGPLTRAIQHAFHPELVEIMSEIRNAEQAYSFHATGDAADGDFIDEADFRKWNLWREKLTVDRAWSSSRIEQLIMRINRARDIDPLCKILVFDEAIFFLDIVAIALEQMNDPVKPLRFDGRTKPEQRTAILEQFEDAEPPTIMLMTRGAGGTGLNITAANVVILTSPWWKLSSETQAIDRSWRAGQKRPVTVIRLLARNAHLELMRRRTRDRKNASNKRIMEGVERGEGRLPALKEMLEWTR